RFPSAPLSGGGCSPACGWLVGSRVAFFLGAEPPDPSRGQRPRTPSPVVRWRVQRSVSGSACWSPSRLCWLPAGSGLAGPGGWLGGPPVGGGCSPGGGGARRLACRVSSGAGPPGSRRGRRPRAPVFCGPVVSSTVGFGVGSLVIASGLLASGGSRAACSAGWGGWLSEVGARPAVAGLVGSR